MYTGSRCGTRRAEFSHYSWDLDLMDKVIKALRRDMATDPLPNA
jgi:hypothetical protein